MVDFFRDVFQFIWAFLSHWQAYMTGGIIMAALTVYERLTQKTVSIRVVIAGIATFILVAFFMAWYDQRNAVREANRTIDDLKNQITELNRKLDDANRALNYEREQNIPKLAGEISQIAFADVRLTPDAPSQAMIFMVVTVRNTGAQSVVTGWHLHIKSKTAEQYKHLSKSYLVF